MRGDDHHELPSVSNPLSRWRGSAISELCPRLLQIVPLIPSHFRIAHAFVGPDSFSTDAAITMIASLPREQAEAVLSRVVMGPDVPTIARVLGKRPGSVRTATHRGLRRLSELQPNVETDDA